MQYTLNVCAIFFTNGFLILSVTLVAPCTTPGANASSPASSVLSKLLLGSIPIAAFIPRLKGTPAAFNTVPATFLTAGTTKEAAPAAAAFSPVVNPSSTIGAYLVMQYLDIFYLLYYCLLKNLLQNYNLEQQLKLQPLLLLFFQEVVT